MKKEVAAGSNMFIVLAILIASERLRSARTTEHHGARTRVAQSCRRGRSRLTRAAVGVGTVRGGDAVAEQRRPVRRERAQSSRGAQPVAVVECRRCARESFSRDRFLRALSATLNARGARSWKIRWKIRRAAKQREREREKEKITFPTL